MRSENGPKNVIDTSCCDPRKKKRMFRDRVWLRREEKERKLSDRRLRELAPKKKGKRPMARHRQDLSGNSTTPATGLQKSKGAKKKKKKKDRVRGTEKCQNTLVSEKKQAAVCTGQKRGLGQKIKS